MALGGDENEIGLVTMLLLLLLLLLLLPTGVVMAETLAGFMTEAYPAGSI